ncbi:MAG: phytanoyl-CoA dioxygenase family protein [Pseudomonadota bacterium]
MNAGFDLQDCNLESFRDLTERTLDPAELRFASGIDKNIPVYSMPELGAALSEPGARRSLLREWAEVLHDLSGVLVLKGAYRDTAVLDEATEVYQAVIGREKAAGEVAADHFAKAGANDRIWNSLEKLCRENPDVFARYFSNVPVAAVCEAWLGPNYQMTSQINVVHPGGQAQEAHRDYHLGFQSEGVAASYPVHTHLLSAALTLQGAIAHCDMPLESGPTKLLPFSQLYPQGYIAFRRPAFRAYFEAACVQLPLSKGDAVFFNPALFHAAGENRSAQIERMANLLQVSSAFGRAMESVDRRHLCTLVYPVVKENIAAGKISPLEVDALIAATAEGYAFPTNLDTDPPVGGLAPDSQADLFRQALETGQSPDAFSDALSQQAARRAP